jgi:glycosyltransferase involved in cell wall biosynthesis
MRIAHIESSMDWGGQELRIVEQCDWLNKHGHPTWIVARPGSAIAEQARARRLPLFTLDIRGSAHPGTSRALAAFVRRERIQLLDCHGNRDATYGAWLKWSQSLPVVRSRHVTDPIRVSWLRRQIWLRGNHSVIVTAGKIRDMLIEEGLSTEPYIHVSAAGVDEQRFHPHIDGRALRERLGIPVDHHVVANIGMIRPDKGQLQFVRACLGLLAKWPLTCIQLGEATTQTADYKEKVLSIAGEALADGRLRFLGYKEDIENWLAIADTVVIASIATEAQTRLVAQAFLMKKNVVATTVGGLPEMIIHEQTGLLVPPHDPGAIQHAVERLLTDLALARRMREAAFDHARMNMSFDYMMGGVLDAYRKAGVRAGRNLD